MTVKQVHHSNTYIRFDTEETGQSIPSRFERMVEKYPDRLAVKDEHHQLTYRELNQDADLLASAIQGRGGGGTEPIALMFGQGTRAIAAILGVLKSGKPYVFLDPGLTSERNRLILEDSGARLVVSDALNFPEANSCDGLVAMNIDDCKATSYINPGIAPDAPACLVYTSGSTGVPKGVLQNHRSLLAGAMNYTNCFQLSYADRVCFLYSPSVIAAVRMMWLALCNGAALYMYDLRAEGFGRLPGWLRQHRITIFSSVASVFRHFTGTLTYADRFPDLRLIRLGGETTLPEDVESYKKHFSEECVLVNRIGSTETGTYSWFRIGKETQIDGASVPVGYPMAGYEILLLDADGEDAGVDQPGEIVVRSRYLSSGIWRRPDLTESSFVSIPGGNGERCYRTGDLGRRTSDGCLIHMGRKDHQVKVRGHRVEVAEIEKALLSFDTVRNAVVMPWKGEGGEPHLVAYFEPTPERIPSVTALRRGLGQQLPGYMIPAYFIEISDFPRAAGGKIDRAALPSPGGERPALIAPFRSPRNPIEETVARIWAEVLGLDEVGVLDPFLELGGDSLRAMQLASRVFATFRVQLSIQSLLDSSTVADVAEELALEQGAAAGRANEISLPSIPFRCDTGPGPLSFSQERIWFLSQLDEISPAYHVTRAFRLKGCLNAGALQRALQAVVDRHEVLRTTYQVVDGIPRQIVQGGRAIELKTIDIGEMRQSVNWEKVRALTKSEIQQLFDLQHDLMIRATLLRLREDDHVLLLVMHHIASDGSGGSSSILAHELSELYTACSCGDAPTLPDLPIQYADFAAWQRSELRGEVLDRQMAYWMHHLAGAPALLPLPTDRPRPARQIYRGACETLEIPAHLSGDLRKLGREERATFFMTLLAGWLTILHRYSGSEDILVGSPTLGRSRIEVEELIGFFGNTLVLRTDLSGNPTFRQLLARVRRVALDAYAHQDLPFEKLVAALEPDRDLSHAPLFQVMFVFQDTQEVFSLAGMETEELHPHTDTSKFDLTLTIRERGDLLAATLEYSTELFDRANVSGMLAHYHGLLERVATDPDRNISSIPLLSDRERHQILVEWNRTAKDYPGGACIHELFEVQVERTPDAIAVLFQSEQLTYRELDQRANALARQLQRAGVGPEVAVGLCADRSTGMMAGLLAILKAGGVYVPLDPTYPAERLAFMMRNSGASVLLTQPHLKNLPVSDVRVMLLNDHPEAAGVYAGKAPDSGVTPDNLAYIMYTSGSSGEPKAVAMPHGPLVNLICWQREHSDCGEGARTLQYAPFGFDVSFQEIFSTWCSGGTLVLIDEDRRRDPAEVLAAISRDFIDRLFMPFAALQHLAEAAQALNVIPATLREVITAGEQLRITPGISYLFENLTDCMLVNQYGPTEAHVVSSCSLGGKPEHWPLLPPIGKPISNTRLYVLDDGLKPVPEGVAGELCIGGASLAREYYNDPGQTADKFIASPFSEEPGDRIYRTGDRARYLADGNIEFLGRVDDQVKIRGFRVEPGEIEVVLGRHPAIRECVVAAREEPTGYERLVAYVVAADRLTFSVEEMLGFLRNILPEYMIPSVVVVMDALPLNPNGGVDRRALPAPETSRPDRLQSFVAPRTEVEMELAEIWSGVLGLEGIGIHDNFFELGGHSLVATQIINKIRLRMNVELPLLVVFLSPTIAEIADRIRTQQDSG